MSTTTSHLAGQALVTHKLHKTARTVTAMFHLAAIAIENAIFEIHAFNVGLLNQEQLISAHAEVPVGERAHLRCTEGDRFRVAVEHDKVVARAMHFGEFQFHVAIVCDTRRQHASADRGMTPAIRGWRLNLNKAPARRAAGS
jgi:hypothetical protein